ncbi:MAG: hypothetical protein D6762_00165 [Candidatus Neomarinimicrobiota bacterium]|nr:MAG: hypothetical protein D6762_00165 [Candidatus Neomarinimicrobiota bacterium]
MNQKLMAFAYFREGNNLKCDRLHARSGRWLFLLLACFQAYLIAQENICRVLPYSRLQAAASVSAAGHLLMNEPPGWVRLQPTQPVNADTVWLLVHGYGSRGYEWIDAIQALGNTGHPVYFYRYDWSRCPKAVVDSLRADFQRLQATVPGSSHHWIWFGHSYGAWIVARLNARFPADAPMEFHAIAGPLAGMKAFQDRCPPDTTWLALSRRSGVGPRLIQWRTLQAQDGAYRDLSRDPQVVSIPGSRVIRLPAEMDGHRLGHNWSVKWVVETFLGLRGNPRGKSGQSEK